MQVAVKYRREKRSSGQIDKLRDLDTYQLRAMQREIRELVACRELLHRVKHTDIEMLVNSLGPSDSRALIRAYRENIQGMEYLLSTRGELTD